MECSGLSEAGHNGGNCRRLTAPGSPVYTRFAKWRNDGTLETVFRVLSSDADMENLSIDSTCIKVRESANGGGTSDNKLYPR